MKKASRGINATIGTLSGAEQISQSCRQSIKVLQQPYGDSHFWLPTGRSPAFVKPSAKTGRAGLDGQPGLSPQDRLLTSTRSLSGCFRASPRLVGFLGEHDRSRAG